MNKKTIITALLALVAMAFASCCSDEPQWADPEAHEKTEQLRAQYTSYIVGTWHYEKTEEQYTDWEDVPDMNGTFKGTWKLVWERIMSGVGENRLTILADWDDETNPVIAYSHNPLFGYADETTLQFAGHWQDSDGWTIYERGEAEPSF